MRATLQRRLVRKLAAYSTAFGASVSTYEAVKATVVYWELGPAGVILTGGALDLDLDGDGNRDFTFSANQFSDTTYRYGGGVFGSIVAVKGALDNRASGYDSNQLAKNLIVDSTISPSAEGITLAVLASRSRAVVCTTSTCTGSSNVAGNFGAGYVGLQFETASVRHAGWAKIEVRGFQAFTLFGFAYETEPGKPILAGDTGATQNTSGDTNADGKVDLEDLNNVRNNFGGVRLGDTNADGVVDLDDLNEVRNNFGAGESNPVPEPPSLVLLAAGATGLAAVRRRRRNRQDECSTENLYNQD